MKKLLVLVLFCISFISCDPKVISHEISFFLNNKTNQDLLITSDYSKSCINGETTLFIGDSVCVVKYTDHRVTVGIPPFNDLNKVAWVLVKVYSKDGKLLKTWDNKDEQSLKSDFFNESKWRVHREDKADGSAKISWTYDITDESFK